MTTTSTLPAQRKPAEAQFIWIALDGKRLSPHLMTPTEAADFAVDHFEHAGREVTVQDGKIGVRHPRISSEYRWYRPTTPNRPPMMWFREGDQSDYPMGSEPNNWLTIDEASARALDGGADRVEIRSGREIIAHHENWATLWIGVPFVAEAITCDDAQKFKDRTERTLTDDQHEAIAAWLMAKSDGMGGHELAKVEDALRVALMGDVK